MARKPNSGKVRIIGGEWRGRLLNVVQSPGLRPTGDRVRETLFNWLTPVLPGASVLDAFAGSGALAFEALSRGAKSATAYESEREVVNCLLENKEMLGANVQVKRMDVRRALAQPANAPFDVIFLDPPFGDDDLSQLCTLIDNNGWLAADGRIYIEQAFNAAPLSLAGFECLREKKAGKVRFALYKKRQDQQGELDG